MSASGSERVTGKIFFLPANKFITILTKLIPEKFEWIWMVVDLTEQNTSIHRCHVTQKLYTVTWHTHTHTQIIPWARWKRDKSISLLRRHWFRKKWAINCPFWSSDTCYFIQKTQIVNSCGRSGRYCAIHFPRKKRCVPNRLASVQRVH